MRTSQRLPKYRWKTSATDLQGRYRTWPDEAGALVNWAKDDVDSLHYLVDLDAVAQRESVWGHDLSTIDHAHPKWAATTAISAVDRCAAALGRITSANPPARRRRHWADIWRRRKAPPVVREYSLRDLRRRRELRPSLPTSAWQWVKEAAADHRYQQLIRIRHPVVHARLRRVVVLGGRNELIVDTHEVSVSTVLLMACSYATERVEDFLARAKAGDF